VLGSLHQLLRGLYATDEARIARPAKEQPDHLYGGLLTVLLRLVFLLYAEIAASSRRRRTRTPAASMAKAMACARCTP
jgi:hypothetical protein